LAGLTTVPTFAPESYTIYEKYQGYEEIHSKEAETKTFKIHHGRGMHYQADYVARSIRDGKLECEHCDHAESRIVMQVFDKVRDQGGYVGKHSMARKG
jgi:hypothetical protein